MRILSLGAKCTIKLEDKNSGKIKKRDLNRLFEITSNSKYIKVNYLQHVQLRLIQARPLRVYRTRLAILSFEFVMNPDVRLSLESDLSIARIHSILMLLYRIISSR